MSPVALMGCRPRVGGQALALVIGNVTALR
jgi:hypothetical protein